MPDAPEDLVSSWSGENRDFGWMSSGGNDLKVPCRKDVRKTWRNDELGGGNSNIFYFHLYLGEMI